MQVLESSVAVDESQPPATHGPGATEPSVEPVLTQLERILASPRFSRSERLSLFLRFVVEEKIAGRVDGLKEYTIGTQVYARGDSFDPATDTIVRVEARRLRATIEKYYANDGRADPVRIDVPKGGYEPVFRWQTQHHGVFPSTAHLSSVAVLPFEDFGCGGDPHSFCDGITEEIIHALAQIEGLHVAARTSAFAFKGHHDVRAVGEALDVATVVEGSVRTEGDQLRVTAQLINVSDGYHLWSKRFDREMKDVFAVQDEIALAVADGVRKQLLGGGDPDLSAKGLVGNPADRAAGEPRAVRRDRRSFGVPPVEEITRSGCQTKGKLHL